VSDATGPRFRRVLSIEDHDFPDSLHDPCLGPVARGVILSPLLAPGRRIVVPVVFCRFAQESASQMAAPSHRSLANMVRRSKTMSRLPQRLEIGRGTEAPRHCRQVSFLNRRLVNPAVR
jgi:hypothetical protein